MRWVFRDDRRRLAQLERGYGVFIERFWASRGEVHFEDPEDGAAVWLRPGEWHIGPLAQLRATPAIARIARGDLSRLLKASTFIERRHPKASHWYLPMIGVAPHATRPRAGLVPAAAHARPLRRGGDARLPRGVERAQPAAVRATRLRRHR